MAQTGIMLGLFYLKGRNIGKYFRKIIAVYENLNVVSFKGYVSQNEERFNLRLNTPHMTEENVS
jgi:hypothetical protein